MLIDKTIKWVKACVFYQTKIWSVTKNCIPKICIEIFNIQVNNTWIDEKSLCNLWMSKFLYWKAQILLSMIHFLVTNSTVLCKLLSNDWLYTIGLNTQFGNDNLFFWITFVKWVDYILYSQLIYCEHQPVSRQTDGLSFKEDCSQCQHSLLN